MNINCYKKGGIYRDAQGNIGIIRCVYNNELLVQYKYALYKVTIKDAEKTFEQLRIFHRLKNKTRLSI